MEDQLERVGVVIPCHNEQERVREVILKTKKHASTIVAVNDGSTDNTLEVLRNADVAYVSYPLNMGKGFALRKGIDYLLQKTNVDYVVVMDADWQHNPEEIPTLVANCQGITCGVRSGNQPRDRQFGNKLINWWLRIVWGIQSRDSQCGFRALTKEAYEKVRWKSNDYFIETEMLIRAKKQKVPVNETPVQMIYHDNYKGQDVIGGIKICFGILAQRFMA